MAKFGPYEFDGPYSGPEALLEEPGVLVVTSGDDGRVLYAEAADNVRAAAASDDAPHGEGLSWWAYYTGSEHERRTAAGMVRYLYHCSYLRSLGL
ncbi:MAG: hypothetical protein DRP90_03270 [Planctomycetota bacterium]|nr:MAG: hypothetical protein DRP90_03270 [Planctomycetota bacterium]